MLYDNFLVGDEFLCKNKNTYMKMASDMAMKQYLGSYKTVRLAKMASDFSVSEQFIESVLFNLISRRKLSYQIDSVNRVLQREGTDGSYTGFRRLLNEGDQLTEQLHHLTKKALV